MTDTNTAAEAPQGNGPATTPSQEAPDTETPQVPQATGTDADQSSDSTDEPLGEGGKKALEAERKARKAAEAAAHEAQRQLEAAKDAELSDLERAQKAAKDAEEEAAKATALADKLRIAARYGLTEDDLDLLPDDMERAERAAQRISSAKSVTPRPDPTQGGTGSASAKSSGDQFADFANQFFTR